MQKTMKIDGYEVKQIQLPEPNDTDPHPRLMFNGWGIHAGAGFMAWLPGGWQEITLEASWEREGAGCWYISTPGLHNICPVGLFCRI
ncbi:hypothetical protein OBV_p-00180 (plasmid) [Oscillibacter valericigenes Sjm18-20]|nr:hypothetical protein OBV_p-00180 [Oscillibacter valericigenes Sjm18-20]